MGNGGGVQVGLEQTYPVSWQGVKTGMEDLVRRAREGDVAAFESLYRKHIGRVYALCLRLTADPARRSRGLAPQRFDIWNRGQASGPGSPKGAHFSRTVGGRIAPQWS